MTPFRTLRRAGLLLASLIIPASAATDVRIAFTLNTTDANGTPIQQNRAYYVYRPDNLPKNVPAPMILLMDGGAATVLHRKADEAGFIAVGCAWSGNASGVPGTGWVNDDPRIVGFEDYDYTSEVIRRVSASENASDVFIAGLSKGGHMSLAYACERPSMLKAAASLDEFMGLTSNFPSAPLPIIVFQGTLDTNVPYVMVKDTVDAWRAVDGLLNVSPVTTYESSALAPGKVSQATWRGGTAGAQVAFVTIIGGSHTYPTPTVQTGYDFTDGLWAFFSQFLSNGQAAPKIVSQPVNNIQIVGQPASFWVTATGGGDLAYQWQRDGKNIPGATSNWLTLPETTVADNGATFRALARNDSGAVTSAEATLTVKEARRDPAIMMEPADQAVTAGRPAAFTAVAAGTPPLRYQWQKNGVNIAGATEASLVISAALPADSGASFSVIVTNGSAAVTSARATLTVTAADGAPIILTNPARVRVLSGETGTFSISAWSQSPMTYQWQKGVFTGNMADIPGATGPAYTTPPGALEDQHTLFRCVVTNAAGTATSASEMLFVTAAPTAPTDVTSPINASAQMGAWFQYDIVSSGGTAPIRYSADPLPGGLTIDPVTGVISGTPAETGIFPVTMTATNAAGSFSRLLTLIVAADPPAISLDAWRRANFGASAIDPSIAGDEADPDGDGYSNLEEFTYGSNPLDPASVPQTVSSAAARGSVRSGRKGKIDRKQ